MYSQTDIDGIKAIVLKTIPGACAIYLFGSYSGGEVSDASDIDILVLVRGKLNWKKRASVLNRFYRETASRGYLVDLILKPAAEFENDRELPTVSRVISRRGKVLWQKT